MYIVCSSCGNHKKMAKTVIGACLSFSGYCSCHLCRYKVTWCAPSQRVPVLRPAIFNRGITGRRYLIKTVTGDVNRQILPLNFQRTCHFTAYCCQYFHSRGKCKYDISNINSMTTFSPQSRLCPCVFTLPPPMRSVVGLCIRPLSLYTHLLWREISNMT
jgi:hypothetical protein